jgi:hypothetical protein
MASHSKPVKRAHPANALPRYDRAAMTRSTKDPLPLPPRRWLRKRPQAKGVYVARYNLTDRPMVAYFDPAGDEQKGFEWNGDNPNAVTWGAIADPEWWYCDGVEPGLPKRADRIWST